MNNIADYTGAFGVGLLLLAYLLTLLKVVNTGSLNYILMNAIGAAFACLASIMIHYFPFIVLEGAWALVSFAALVKRLGKTGA